MQKRSLVGLAMLAAFSLAVTVTPAAAGASDHEDEAGGGWGPIERVGTGRYANSEATYTGDVATTWYRHDAVKVARLPYGGSWTNPRLLAPVGTSQVLRTATADRWLYVWHEDASESHPARLMSRWHTADGQLGPVHEVGEAEPAYDGDIWIESTESGAAVIAGLYEPGGQFGMVLRVSVDGETWTELPPLPQGVTTPWTDPGFTVDASGRVTYVSIQNRDTPQARVVALRSNGDQPWSVTKIGPRSGHTLDEVYSGASGASGDLVVSWEETEVATGDHMLVAASHLAEDPIAKWDVVTLDPDTTCGGFRCNDVDIDAAGNASVVWSQNAPGGGDRVDVLIVRHSDDGWGAPQALLTSVAYAFTSSSTSLVVAASGDVVFTYPAGSGNTHVFQCAPDPAALCVAGPQLFWPDMSSGDSYQVDAGPDGYVVATRRIRPGHGTDKTEIQTQTLGPAA